MISTTSRVYEGAFGAWWCVHQYQDMCDFMFGVMWDILNLVLASFCVPICILMVVLMSVMGGVGDTTDETWFMCWWLLLADIICQLLSVAYFMVIIYEYIP
jgi:hypothetical protein